MPHEMRLCPTCEGSGTIYHNPDPTQPPRIIPCPPCVGVGSRIMFVYVLQHELRRRGRR